MGTKQNPATHDCHAKALPDEPLFTLLGRDPQAPGLILMWARERETAISEGRQPASDTLLVQEARELAHRMIYWRLNNDGAWRAKNPELPGLCDCGFGADTFGFRCSCALARITPMQADPEHLPLGSGHTTDAEPRTADMCEIAAATRAG